VDQEIITILSTALLNQFLYVSFAGGLLPIIDVVLITEGMARYAVIYLVCEMVLYYTQYIKLISLPE
jgi:hypothetical protein